MILTNGYHHYLNIKETLIVDSRATREAVVIGEVIISNVFIGLIKLGDGPLIIKGDLTIHDFGGDAINLRGSNFNVNGIYRTFGNSPSRPYSEYHQDCILQAYAVLNDGFTLNPKGSIENVIIPRIIAEIKGKEAQGLICSESCSYKKWEIGTKLLKVKSEHPFPFMFNTVQALRLGNESASVEGAVRVSNVKKSSHQSSDVIILGVRYISDETIKKKVNPMYDVKKEFPKSMGSDGKFARGYRNNNPGNIKDFGIPWIGLSKKAERLDYQKNEEVMCVFSHPKWGIRAICLDLMNKQKKYASCKNIRGILSRYAPANVDKNKTEEYIFYVSGQAGITDSEVISILNYDTCYNIVKAMISFENGRVESYPNDVMMEGMLLAGVVSPTERKATGVKKQSQSKGMRNGAIVATGGVVTSADKITSMVEKGLNGITAVEMAVLIMLFIITFAALDWMLDRRLTHLLGIK